MSALSGILHNLLWCQKENQEHCGLILLLQLSLCECICGWWIMLVKSVGDKKIRKKKREGKDGVFWKVKAPGRHPGQLRPASLELPCDGRSGRAPRVSDGCWRAQVPAALFIYLGERGLVCPHVGGLAGAWCFSILLVSLFHKYSFSAWYVCI